MEEAIAVEGRVLSYRIQREKLQVPESNGWAHSFEGVVGGARIYIWVVA